MFDDIKSISSGKKELRKFGITVGIVLGLLGGLLLWHDRDFYYYFFIISGVLIALGLIAPILLKPVYKAWMALAFVLSWVMTRLILVLLYYIFFTSIGFFARLLNRDILALKFDPGASSYWIPKGTSDYNRASYEHQY